MVSQLILLLGMGRITGTSFKNSKIILHFILYKNITIILSNIGGQTSGNRKKTSGIIKWIIPDDFPEKFTILELFLVERRRKIHKPGQKKAHDYGNP
jgi:hypothetical protein